MRASRLISLLLLLQTRGRLTAAELAERLEVSVRTVYRDLDALSLAGIPVYAERGPGGGCCLVEGYKSALTGLTGGEAEALFLAGLPGPAAELGLGTVLAAAELKLLASLPEPVRQSATLARQRFHLDASGWFRPPAPHPELERVASAVWANQRLAFRYQRSDREQRTRRVEPLGLVQKSGLWYLVARVEEGPRVYRVSRMSEVRLLDEPFERDPDFDLASFWSSWARAFEAGLPIYPVTLRIAPAALARLADKLAEQPERLPDAPAPLREPDGWTRCVLDFERLEYACSALLALGADAEVLEPAELRTELRETLERLGKLYSGAAG